MKLKADFVTNSSSTAYIVFIPNDFYANENYLQRICNGKRTQCYPELKEDTSEIVDDIQTMIEELKEGSDIYYEEVLYKMIAWGTLVEICEENNFIISEVNINNEGNNTLQGVTEETILRILTSHINLDKFMKPFMKGGNDVTKITKEV